MCVAYILGEIIIESRQLLLFHLLHADMQRHVPFGLLSVLVFIFMDQFDILLITLLHSDELTGELVVFFIEQYSLVFLLFTVLVGILVIDDDIISLFCRPVHTHESGKTLSE